MSWDAVERRLRALFGWVVRHPVAAAVIVLLAILWLAPQVIAGFLVGLGERLAWVLGKSTKLIVLVVALWVAWRVMTKKGGSGK